MGAANCYVKNDTELVLSSGARTLNPGEGEWVQAGVEIDGIMCENGATYYLSKSPKVIKLVEREREREQRELTFVSTKKKNLTRSLVNFGAVNTKKGLDPEDTVQGGGKNNPGTSGLIFDKAKETSILKMSMHKWVKSTDCCPPSCGSCRCGILIICKTDTGKSSNLLYERCNQHGGGGHKETFTQYCKDTRKERLYAALIYGYSIQKEGLRMNSVTFNGAKNAIDPNGITTLSDMPDTLQTNFPNIYEATRSGKKIMYRLF